MITFKDFPVVASFAAGIASFVSPCVLPMIPAYISFITGVSVDDLKEGRASAVRAFLNSVFFVLGFSIVFILLGASASYAGALMTDNREILKWAGGIIVIIFGLHLTGLFKIKFLYMEKRMDMKIGPAGFVSSFIVGLTFSVGWTPCVGPILSSILILASAQATMKSGVLLLIVYCLGLGLPFMVTALFVGRALKMFNAIKANYKYIEIASGLMLIAVGIMIITDTFRVLSGLLVF